MKIRFIILITVTVLLFQFIIVATAETLMEYDEITLDQHKEEIKMRDLDVPNREIAVIATKEGFYPEKIAVFEGERVRFMVTTTADSPSCFIISKKELFLSANKGRITEGDVKFEDSGEYEFHCPAGNIRGKVTVLERPDEVRAARKIASEEEEDELRPSYWIPREQ